MNEISDVLGKAGHDVVGFFIVLVLGISNVIFTKY
jgi:hypothetical protein